MITGLPAVSLRPPFCSDRPVPALPRIGFDEHSAIEIESSENSALPAVNVPGIAVRNVFSAATCDEHVDGLMFIHTHVKPPETSVPLIMSASVRSHDTASDGVNPTPVLQVAATN